MEHSYWLGRKRASAANAKLASSAEARLAHLELAGRYSIKAAQCAPARPEPQALRLALPGPGRADRAYYARLEAGARWLASRSDADSEREDHIGMANLYARLRHDANSDGR